MRIISGKFRGKVLNSPKDLSVRPTSDRIKESIFNILQFKIPNCNFLDVFAGSGAMGIEAISRGANQVVFCDNSKESITLLKSNLSLINSQAIVKFCDYIELLKTVDTKFDIIYLDPPYAMRNIVQISQIIDSRKLISIGGWIVYEHSADYIFDGELIGFDLVQHKKYGNTVIEIFEKKI